MDLNASKFWPPSVKDPRDRRSTSVAQGGRFEDGGDRFTLSVVIPVYNGSATVEGVVEGVLNELSHEHLQVVLVNDGSSDNSQAVCSSLVDKYPLQVELINLARNYGEHNAVMAGLRVCQADYAAIIDDDGQHAPSDVRRMLQHARLKNLDVVYGRFRRRYHPATRVLASWLVNCMARVLLRKPRKLYLSSFKVMNRFAIDGVGRYRGPTPYVDGLVLRITDRIEQIEVEHRPPVAGRSRYNFGRLLAFWLGIVFEYSVAPFRVAILLGLALMLLGFLATAALAGFSVLSAGMVPGWAWTPGLASAFTGLQLCAFGLLAEYASRLMLHLSGMPQQIVRSFKLGDEGQPTDEETMSKWDDDALRSSSTSN